MTDPVLGGIKLVFGIKEIDLLNMSKFEEFSEMYLRQNLKKRKKK